MNRDENQFEDATAGLIAGDFTKWEPIFVSSTDNPLQCQVVEWFDQGLFSDRQKALNEALTCACFLGHTDVAEYLMDQGVDPSAGDGTGFDALHWAANRGQQRVVEILIQRGVSMESVSRFGGTVLGTAVWSTLNEPKPNHVQIVKMLLDAGAELDGARLKDLGFPTGHQELDETLSRYVDFSG